MKKALSLILIAFILIATLASCNDATDPTEQPSGDPTSAPTNAPTEAPKDTGISKEEWQAAIADEKFDNVTILFDIDYVENDTNMNMNMNVVDNVQTLKIYNDTVYRSSVLDGEMGGSSTFFATYFTGNDAIVQRKMFLDVFLALLAEKDNYEYDAESKTYIAPEKISVTVYPDDNSADLVEMEEGVVTFDDSGRLVSFACKLKETVTSTYEGQTNTLSLPVCNTTWTFSDYGTTVITEEEIEAASLQGGSDNAEENGAQNDSGNPEENGAQDDAANSVRGDEESKTE